METINNQEVVPEVPIETVEIPPPQKLSPIKVTPLMKIGIIVLGVVIVLLLLLTLIRPGTSDVPAVLPSPLPSTDATGISPAPRVVSTFGQSEAFIHFETAVDELIKNQNTLDLTESALTFPTLEMNVNYKKN